jgi:hypothetical protein
MVKLNLTRPRRCSETDTVSRASAVCGRRSPLNADQDALREPVPLDVSQARTLWHVSNRCLQVARSR